ncbi:MAG: hypothetical protein WD534_12780 [Phycisphaeraceae bacterium]
MEESKPETIIEDMPAAVQAGEEVRDRLEKAFHSGKWGRYKRLILAALSSVPWVGGMFAGAATFSADSDQAELNELYRQWLEQHQDSVKKLGASLLSIITRLESLAVELDERIQSEEYLSLVRRAFKTWDQAETEEKRRLIQNLLTNAAAVRICSDDVVRLFIEWIEKYHEIHFKVIREVFKHEGAGRGDIWANIHGERVREDSAEADLFKLLIHDLSLGHVIRQHRPTDFYGNFIKKQPQKTPKGQGSRTMKSAFDNSDQYELTELGKQFVHYTMNEVVPRIGSHTDAKV